MEFEVDELVWAKMKGYPLWPAIVADPRCNVKFLSRAPKNEAAYVFLKFFGSSDVAWILKKYVTSHSESILQDLKDKKKTKKYQQSIDEFLLFLSKTGKDKKESLPKVEGAAGDKKEMSAVEFIKTAPNKRQIIKNEKSPIKNVTKRIHAVKKVQALDNQEDSDISEKHNPLLDLTYGFMGLCTFGRAVLLKLVRSGIKVFLYDPSIDEVMKYISGIKEITRANSPAELIKVCDVTFCCYEADSKEFADIVYGEDNIIKGFDDAEKLGRKPGYVQLTCIDLKTSEMINQAAIVKNAVYLEAPINGSCEDVSTGEAVINAAGDRNLFTKCEKVFDLLSRNYTFVGCDIGISSYTSMLLNTVTGTVNSAISETLTLAERINIDLSERDINDAVEKIFGDDHLMQIVERMGNRTTEVGIPLKHVQKNIDSALELADEVNQQMPMAAAANELYKRGRQLNYSDADVSAIYKVIKY